MKRKSATPWRMNLFLNKCSTMLWLSFVVHNQHVELYSIKTAFTMLNDLLGDMCSGFRPSVQTALVYSQRSVDLLPQHSLNGKITPNTEMNVWESIYFLVSNSFNFTGFWLGFCDNNYNDYFFLDNKCFLEASLTKKCYMRPNRERGIKRNTLTWTRNKIIISAMFSCRAALTEIHKFFCYNVYAHLPLSPCGIIFIFCRLNGLRKKIHCFEKRTKY